MADQTRIGLRIPSTPAVNVEALQRFVLEAEALGFHSLWVGDHLFHPVDVYHPMIIMTWMAALTSRVRLGTAILLFAYRDPVFFAKEAASLDKLSGGRLTLGVSLGGVPSEYEALGVPMKQRAARFRENLQVLRRFTEGKPVTFEGRFTQLRGQTVNPMPVQRPVPILLGGSHERSLRRAAELCDGWIATSGAPLADFAPKVRQVQEFAKEFGRDPRDLQFGKLLSVSLAQDRHEAIRLAESHLGPYYGGRFDIARDAVCGTPQEIAAGVRAFTEVDASNLTMILEPPTLDLDHLRRLAGVVLPLEHG